MQIILLHRHFDVAHLEAVKAEMLVRGAPVIRAVWSECYGAWAALEGCHRIRAAHALGIIPEIEEIEYDEAATLSEIGVEIEDECTISEVMDGAWQSETIRFEED